MAISVEGKYFFLFNITDVTDRIVARDFIFEGNLIRFALIEQAGNAMPRFEMAFTTTDDSILRRLNEGNVLKVSYGRDSSQLHDVNLSISRVTGPIRGAEERFIYINGLLRTAGYNSNPKTRIFEQLSGLEVLRQIADESFLVETGDFNRDTSEDVQNWIQHNISDKRFVNEVWMHSYLSESFLGLGVTSTGKFVVKDMKRLASSTPSYLFTTTLQENVVGRPILYDSDFQVDSRMGLINAWLGRGRDKLVYDLEEGLSDTVSEDVGPLIALTTRLSRRADLERRSAEAGIRSDNVHSNYWRAHFRNLMGNAVFSTINLVVSFHSQFEDIQVLDLVSFQDREINSPLPMESYSGLYIVSNVTREITRGTLATTCTLVRESMNSPLGTFVDAL